MSRLQNFDQFQLFSFNIEQYLPLDHWVFLLDEILNSLDYSGLTWKTGVNATNQESFEKKLLAKLWLAGYFKRVRSCRQLADVCKNDIGFIFLLRNAESPNKSTLNDFRKQNLDQLSKILAQTVCVAKDFGLLSGHVSIDGTKVKANASIKNHLDKKKLSESFTELEKKCKEYLNSVKDNDKQELHEEIESKLKVTEERKKKIKDKLKLLEALNKEKHNTTDPDCSMMKDCGQYYDGYNAQAATDNQFVIFTSVSNEANDLNQLEPMVEGCLKQEGYKLSAVTCDAGYENGEHLSNLENKGVDVLTASQERNNQGGELFGVKDFTYVEENDKFSCPNGKELAFDRERDDKSKKRKARKIRLYKSSEEDCKACPVKNQCLSKRRKVRELKVSKYFKAIDENKRKGKTESGRNRFKNRKTDVECVFGQIKGHIGVLHFNLKSLNKIKGEWLLICLGHNLRKLVSHKRKISLRKRIEVFKTIYFLIFLIFHTGKLKKIEFYFTKCEQNQRKWLKNQPFFKLIKKFNF